jgi:hypothetical protein
MTMLRTAARSASYEAPLYQNGLPSQASSRPKADCVSAPARNECGRMWNARVLLHELREGYTEG